MTTNWTQPWKRLKLQNSATLIKGGFRPFSSWHVPHESQATRPLLRPQRGLRVWSTLGESGFERMCLELKIWNPRQEIYSPVHFCLHPFLFLVSARFCRLCMTPREILVWDRTLLLNLVFCIPRNAAYFYACTQAAFSARPTSWRDSLRLCASVRIVNSQQR